MRSGKGRLLYFGILGVAAVALLAIFFLHGTEERPPVEQSVVAAPEVPAPQVVPVSNPVKSERVAPEAPPEGVERAKETTPAPPAGGAGARLGAEDENVYPGSRVDRKIIMALHGNGPLTRNHPHVAGIIEVQERHTDELMAHPAVVGTAVGLNEKGQMALVVLTKREAPDIPAFIEGIPVVVWKSGEYFSRDKVMTQDAVSSRDDVTARGKPPSVDHTARFDRPVPIGVSTGHPNITAGTIGCRVTDGTDVWALSNNHVYANSNAASAGDAVIQPGKFDGGISPADDIGTLANFEPIKFDGSDNTIDAAIALTTTALVGNSTPDGGGYYGTPDNDSVLPEIDRKVTKVGRTTGQTNGKIVAINATVNVNYGSSVGVAKFVNQIVVTPGKFSAGGDSGSLIVTNDPDDDPDQNGGYNPVGLLFAGSATSTIANPINAVLTRYNVSVDGADNPIGTGDGGSKGGPPPGKGKKNK